MAIGKFQYFVNIPKQENLTQIKVRSGSVIIYL
jgi:hypothetical protein